MKLILSIIFSVLMLSANERIEHHRANILEKVFSQISINENLKIWCDDNSLMSQLKDHNRLQIVDDCLSANLILLNNQGNLSQSCENKHIFALKYDILSDIPSSFGAFFWKKGRPNIVIIKPRLESQSIKISKRLEEYLEEEVW